MYYTYVYIYIHTYITLHYITLRYATLRYVTLHYITLHTYIHTHTQTCSSWFRMSKSKDYARVYDLRLRLQASHGFVQSPSPTSSLGTAPLGTRLVHVVFLSQVIFKLDVEPVGFRSKSVNCCPQN